jgi:methionyl-tRNA formyltransferase
MLKIIFFGTSDFSAEILRSLLQENDLRIIAVITQPDKPVGRKMIIQESPIAVAAKEAGLLILKPSNLKAPEFINQIRSLQPDFFVVVAYGRIIPKEILEIPSLGPLNIHGSLLPKYRGASPIHTALLNGDSKTGITTMLMDDQMDHGPILIQDTVHINENETFPELERELCELAKKLIIKTIHGVADKNIQPREQDHSEATFTKIIEKNDGKINWEDSAKNIYNRYRAFILWPGIFTIWNEKTLKITKAALSEQESGHEAGTVFEKEEQIFVQANPGALQILEIQLEGKKPVAITDFLRGYKNFIGSKLG